MARDRDAGIPRGAKVARSTASASSDTSGLYSTYDPAPHTYRARLPEHPFFCTRMFRVPVWLFRAVPHDVGWTPYLWLFYLVPFLLRPLTGAGSLWENVASWVLLAIFLWSYFNAYSAMSALRPLHMAVQAGVGVALLPWNPGAAVFFIYAAAVGGMLEDERRAWAAILSMLVLGAGWAAVVDGRLTTVASVAFMAPMVGAATLHQARERRASAALQAATARNVELAAMAERERIARDLHDALGHTLTLLVLKAQVARRLALVPDVESDQLTQLARELAELEVAARDALAGVRSTLRGYRATLDDAINAARTLLHAASVGVTVDVALRDADAARDAVLGAVLRELSTNVARHAMARLCTIAVREDADGTALTVWDDGRGGAVLDGHGLRGVAERLAAVGGSLEISGAAAGCGTCIIARLPPATSGMPARTRVVSTGTCRTPDAVTAPASEHAVSMVIL